jgi:hypothetical protein
MNIIDSRDYSYDCGPNNKYSVIFIDRKEDSVGDRVEIVGRQRETPQERTGYANKTQD